MLLMINQRALHPLYSLVIIVAPNSPMCAALMASSGGDGRKQTYGLLVYLLPGRHVNLLDYYLPLLSVRSTRCRCGRLRQLAARLVDGQDVAVIFPNDNLSSNDDYDRRHSAAELFPNKPVASSVGRFLSSIC